MPHLGPLFEGTTQEVAQYVKDDFSLGMVQIPPEKLIKTVKIQWIESSLNDPGDDWNRADFYDIEGALVHQVMLTGY